MRGLSSDSRPGYRKKPRFGEIFSIQAASGGLVCNQRVFALYVIGHGRLPVSVCNHAKRVCPPSARLEWHKGRAYKVFDPDYIQPFGLITFTPFGVITYKGCALDKIHAERGF